MPLVEIHQVSKAYRRGGERVPVLEGVDLDIPAGEFLALMGPSGSGKSTLLNLIAGLDRPDAGRIRVAGVDITGLPETALARWRASHVGFIFQFYNLIPVLTALENVELPLLLTALSRRERREHAELALNLVGLDDRASHFPGQLSGGQQQRVAIARALVNDPVLILADEPTGALDSRTSFEVMALLQALNRGGITVVLVTHEHDIAAFAGRVVTFRDGRVVEDRREPNPVDAAVARAGLEAQPA